MSLLIFLFAFGELGGGANTLTGMHKKVVYPFHLIVYSRGIQTE